MTRDRRSVNSLSIALVGLLLLRTQMYAGDIVTFEEIFGFDQDVPSVGSWLGFITPPSTTTLEKLKAERAQARFPFMDEPEIVAWMLKRFYRFALS